jgi:dGTPase
VEYIEYRYPAFRGLNLTFEVREGIIKHSRDWDAQQHPELREYLLDERPPLEAQLIDLTDEIAYNTADLDDAVESRIVTIQQMRENVPLFARLYEQVQSEYPCIREKVCLLEAIKRMLDFFAGDLITNTAARLEQFGIRSLEDVRHAPERIACLSPAAEHARAQTKRFLYEALYFSTHLKGHKDHGEHVIEDLFRFWMSNPEALPTTYRQMAGLEPTSDPLVNIEPLHRIVCDYIAGMTDSFCLNQHARFVPV